MSAESNEAEAGSSRSRLVLALIPLALFIGLAAIFLGQLLSGKDPSILPVALKGQPAPDLNLPALEGLMRDGNQVPALTNAEIEGKISLVNIWASWCVPCRQEHPILMELAKDKRLNVVGINYKDVSANALRFLGELGNPFAAVGTDPNGRTSIDWGVYGIPETYLVDADGTILYKKVGPFVPSDVTEHLLPAIEAAHK